MAESRCSCCWMPSRCFSPSRWTDVSKVVAAAWRTSRSKPMGRTIRPSRPDYARKSTRPRAFVRSRAYRDTPTRVGYRRTWVHMCTARTPPVFR